MTQQNDRLPVTHPSLRSPEDREPLGIEWRHGFPIQNGQGQTHCRTLRIQNSLPKVPKDSASRQDGNNDGNGTHPSQCHILFCDLCILDRQFTFQRYNALL